MYWDGPWSLPLPLPSHVFDRHSKLHGNIAKWCNPAVRLGHCCMFRMVRFVGAKVAVVDYLCMEVQVCPLSLPSTTACSIKWVFFHFYQLSSRAHLSLAFSDLVTTMVNPRDPAPRTTNSCSRSTASRQPSAFQSIMVRPMVDPDCPPYQLPGTRPGESELWRLQAESPFFEWLPSPLLLSSGYLGGYNFLS